VPRDGPARNEWTRTSTTLTVTLTLGAPPSAAQALACSGAGSSFGGLWGAEFWAASPIGPVPANPSEDSNEFGNANFYIAYRDNPLDATGRLRGSRRGS
jgi:hypothetical protein